MCDVLLIQPKDIFSGRTSIQNTIPTHLLLLGTVLKQEGFSTIIFPLFFNENPNIAGDFDKISFYFNKLVDSFKQFKSVRYVGISCYVSSYYLTTVLTAWAVRKAIPDATILVGGYGPNTVISDFIYENSPFDYVFMGEADLEFTRILKKLEKGSKQERFPGKNGKAEIIKCTEIEELDSLPLIDWTLLDNTPYKRLNSISIPFYSSRGCPFHCRFCCDMSDLSELHYHKRWRPRFYKNVIVEIDSLHNYLESRPINILFVDPIFGLKRSWKVTLLHSLIDLTQDWKNCTITLEERVDTINEEDIKLYSKLDACVNLGFESGSARILELMNKTKNPEKYLDKMIKNRDIFEEYHVYYVVNVLFGFPGETKKELYESQEYLSDFFRYTKYGIPNAVKFAFFPGSYVYKYQKEEFAETDIMVPDWYKRNINHNKIKFLLDPSKGLGGLELLDITARWAKPFFENVIKNFTPVKNRMLLYTQLKQYLNSNARIGDPGEIEPIKELAEKISVKLPELLPVDNRLMEIITAGSSAII